MSVMTPDDKARLTVLRRAVEAAGNTLARLAALTHFFTACDSFLSSEDRSSGLIVFNEAAFLLGSRVADGVVWDWWQEQARKAVTLNRRASMHVAFFELVVELPIIWPDLYRFWDFWLDPAARWAIFDAYEGCPRRLRSHLSRYSSHRRRLKLPLPEFSHEEFRAYLQGFDGRPLNKVSHFGTFDAPEAPETPETKNDINTEFS